MPISYTLTTPVTEYPYVFPPDASTGLTGTVDDLFKQLSYGELRDLYPAQNGIGAIAPDNRNQVLHFANEGLKTLHQRFELIRDDEVLTVPASAVEYRHLLDPTELQVLSMLLENGSSLTFLTHPVPGQIFLYKRMLFFPPTSVEYKVQVTYQMRHPVLQPILTDEDLEQPILLVSEMWAALRSYIAGELYGGMNGQDAQISAAKHRNKYLEICLEMEATGTPAQQMLDIQKSDMRGFV